MESKPRIAHIAGFQEFLMEGKSGAERLGGMAVFGEFEIAPEQIPIGGIDAMVDDQFGAFAGCFAAEVGDAVLGDQNLHRVFAVVDVGTHRDDGGDVATLGGGGAGENGDIGVAGEVTRPADAVHHGTAEDMGAVDVAEDIRFEGGID